MKKYKVLTVKNENNSQVLYSPFQNYIYGTLESVLGKEFVCDDFDENDKECSNGFYATDVEGLIYSINRNKNNRVFEVEVNGKSKVFNKYKQRYEKQTIIKMLDDEEVKALIKEQSDKMDWNYYNCVYPVNPLGIKANEVTEEDIKNLKKVALVSNSVRTSVWTSVSDSVWASVWASVSDSVWASVRTSVRASVKDSVWACIGVSFYNIKKWKYIDHKEGVYPFQFYIDLHNKGFVPSLEGEMWRLHAGVDAKVVYEISQEELLKL